METWWIGPAIGATGLALGWHRGRRADARLRAIEDAVVRRPEEQPETHNRARAEEELNLNLGSLELREALGHAIAQLPEREKLVVTLYYYEELTMREIGEVLGVTASRVSQIHTKAVSRLKSHLSGQGP